jgi:RND family efflux transporter MFP subunit
MQRRLLPSLALVCVLASALTVGLSACDRKPKGAANADAVSQLIVAPEDVLTIAGSALTSGPVVTGSIQPERKADLRAEVSAVVLQVLKENGDAVRRGDVLVRLDETSIRDNLASAEDGARNAALALDQAERNLKRLKTLRESGMTSLQALDDAEVRRNAAQSELSAANARAALARQQLQRTVVRAPFDGVVGDRKVSAGDTASIGKELLKVIDPSSMRFAGRVSADKISEVKVGQAVGFQINGYGDQEFRGKVTRVDPSANDITRQVEVLVSFSDAKQPRVAGLYAEGTIESSRVSALMLPEAVLLRAGDKTSVWRIKDKLLSLVDVAVGERDPRTGNYEIRSGLAAGDVIVRSPNSRYKAGQTVEMVTSKPGAAASAPAAAASAAPAAQGK